MLFLVAIFISFFATIILSCRFIFFLGKFFLLVFAVGLVDDDFDVVERLEAERRVESLLFGLIDHIIVLEFGNHVAI